MPFSGGNFTLAQPAFQPNTAISSSAVNSDLSDIASGLSAVICKDGSSTPTAAIPLHADGFTYSVDPDTGIHRTAANTQAIKCGGVDVLVIDSTGAVTNSGGWVLGPIPGEIKMWGLTAAPTGWALCDGTALTATSPLRTALIAASNPYGVSGSDPLLPDMRGRYPAGKDTTGTRITVAGGNFNGNVLGGSQDRQGVTLTTAQLASHTHTGTTGIESALHSHTTTDSGIFGASNTQNSTLSGGATAVPTPSTNLQAQNTGTESASHTHSFTTAASGSGSAHPTLPGTLIVNFIIFVGA